MCAEIATISSRIVKHHGPVEGLFLAPESEKIIEKETTMKE
jgi:hypothetical protein